MAQGYEYGSGYQYGIPLPASEYGNRPAAEYVKGLSFSQSGSTVTITVTDQDGTATPYTFETGSDDAITGISITNENGVYTVKATTAGGTETEIGTIEVPTVNVDNLLAEINDEVVEDNTNGYDFHTLKETENNGTVNEVGKFYLAQNQLLGPQQNRTLTWEKPSLFYKVDQDGNMTEVFPFFYHKELHRALALNDDPSTVKYLHVFLPTGAGNVYFNFYIPYDVIVHAIQATDTSAPTGLRYFQIASGLPVTLTIVRTSTTAYEVYVSVAYPAMSSSVTFNGFFAREIAAS